MVYGAVGGAVGDVVGGIINGVVPSKPQILKQLRSEKLTSTSMQVASILLFPDVIWGGPKKK